MSKINNSHLPPPSSLLHPPFSFPPLFIRSDSTPQIGTGHIMRCIALAQAWQDRGGKVTFISHCETDTLRQRIMDEGFDFIPIENPYPDPSDLSQTLAHLKSLFPPPSSVLHPPSSILRPPTWLILDGYHFTPDYQKAIRDAGIHLLVIDDMNHLPYYHADILLNQNIHATELKYHCDKDTKLLLGTKYVLLRREFLRYRGFKRHIPEKAKKILVTLGGADPDNVTLKVVKALNLIGDPDLEVKIVVGPSNPHIESLKREILRSPFSVLLLPSVSNMADLMAWADVAISAGGSTLWELCFMDVHSIVITVADNQEEVVRYLGQIGLVYNFGRFREIKDQELAHQIDELIKQFKKRRIMSKLFQNMIDGNGIYRVLERML